MSGKRGQEKHLFPYMSTYITETMIAPLHDALPKTSIGLISNLEINHASKIANNTNKKGPTFP